MIAWIVDTGRSVSERRDELLEQAIDVFARHGVTGTSIRRLGTALGVASSTLYHHFGSKEGLLDAVVEPHLDKVDALLDELGTGADPAVMLRRYLELLLEGWKVVRLLERDLDIHHHPVHGERLRDQAQRLRSVLAGAGAGPEDELRAAAALGTLRRPALRREELPAIQPDVVVTAALAALGRTR